MSLELLKTFLRKISRLFYSNDFTPIIMDYLIDNPIYSYILFILPIKCRSNIIGLYFKI